MDTFSLISLNTWGARVYYAYQYFLHTTRQSTDIYCFQEMHDCIHKMDQNDEGTLPWQLQYTNTVLNPTNHTFANRMTTRKSFHQIRFGCSIASGIMRIDYRTKPKLHIRQESSEFILGLMNEPIGNHDSDPVLLQRTVFVTDSGNEFSVFNFHGYHEPGIGKGDTPERLLQSKKLINILSQIQHPWILCGDFNLDLKTVSIKMLESLHCRNLIQEYGIATTRTIHYPEEKRRLYPYADYMFTKGIQVDSFSVDAACEASDHAPLFLTFSV